LGDAPFLLVFVTKEGKLCSDGWQLFVKVLD